MIIKREQYNKQIKEPTNMKNMVEDPLPHCTWYMLIGKRIYIEDVRLKFQIVFLPFLFIVSQYDNTRVVFLFTVY